MAMAPVLKAEKVKINKNIIWFEKPADAMAWALMSWPSIMVSETPSMVLRAISIIAGRDRVKMDKIIAFLILSVFIYILLYNGFILPHLTWDGLVLFL